MNLTFTCLKQSCFDILKAHELKPEKLEKRKVVYIDIANDPVKASDYKEEWDPMKVRSEKAGRGPLSKNWRVNITFSSLWSKAVQKYTKTKKSLCQW